MSNHRRMSSGTFTDLSLRCTSKLQMLALTAFFPATVNSLTFLFLLVILQFSSWALSNRSVAKCYGLIDNNNLLRMAPHPGKSAPWPMAVAVASL